MAFISFGQLWAKATDVHRARTAAVLVPIIAHPGALSVLFTQRTAHLKAHSGQVSFPGGRAEPGDASPEDTALRESEEEIGLPRDRVEVLARLPEYFTRTGFRVTPVVGLIEPPLQLSPDPGEVESVFEVPLAFLLDTRNHQRHTREFQGTTVGYYAMPYSTVEGERYIWGATAGMLVSLCRALAD
jgi:8-oxo-dGTP pyrophosphatase MutT (NUDIX family)